MINELKRILDVSKEVELVIEKLGGCIALTNSPLKEIRFFTAKEIIDDLKSYRNKYYIEGDIPKNIVLIAHSKEEDLYILTDGKKVYTSYEAYSYEVLDSKEYKLPSDLKSFIKKLNIKKNDINLKGSSKLDKATTEDIRRVIFSNKVAEYVMSEFLPKYYGSKGRLKKSLDKFGVVGNDVYVPVFSSKKHDMESNPKDYLLETDKADMLDISKLFSAEGTKDNSLDPAYIKGYKPLLVVSKLNNKDKIEDLSVICTIGTTLDVAICNFKKVKKEKGFFFIETTFQLEFQKSVKTKLTLVELLKEYL